jgi:hypothetical protein
MAMSRVVLGAMILCSSLAIAQNVEVKAKPLTESDIKLLRQDVQSIKDRVITDTMQFSPAESTAFWPVYRDYAREQHALAQKRLGVITEYARTVDNMNDSTADNLTQRMFQIEDETVALRRKYYPRLLKALGAKRAARFYQVDNRLTTMVNVQLASEIPLVP